jgi:purine-nucleoside phosphorylase
MAVLQVVCATDSINNEGIKKEIKKKKDFMPIGSTKCAQKIIKVAKKAKGM